MSFIQIIELRTKSSDELKALPETALLDGPPSSSDLDVIEDRS
jgi:hypothetical protein